jgi:DNA integrity scanning protein DisA with diadenylate cyclase activity
MPKPYKKKTRTKKANAKAKVKAGFVSARAHELLASIEATLIQNHARLAQSIARIVPILVLKSRQYKTFINSVTTSYEYKRKNIPSILLTMLAQSNTVLQRVNHLLRFHNEPGFLQAELGRHGVNAISAFIELTLTSMEELEETMSDYTQNALADYRGAQLGIETQPNMRNTTTRRTDAIVRPGRTTRAQALTRRTRSF